MSQTPQHDRTESDRPATFRVDVPAASLETERDPMSTPSIDDIIAIARRFNEARNLRLSTGMWLQLTELRLRDADQMPAFKEHAESAPPTQHNGFGATLGVPIRYDETVPPATARLIYEDGSMSDHKLT